MTIYLGSDIKSVAFAPCTKCGQVHEACMPRFVEWSSLHELLSWPCRQCGHKIFTLPLDAPADHAMRFQSQELAV